MTALQQAEAGDEAEAVEGAAVLEEGNLVVLQEEEGGPSKKSFGTMSRDGKSERHRRWRRKTPEI